MMKQKQTFVWVKDRFGLVGCWPGYRIEMSYLPGGTFVSIYEKGKTTPSRVVEGTVVYMGPERRKVERGLETNLFTSEVE